MLKIYLVQYVIIKGCDEQSHQWIYIHKNKSAAYFSPPQKINNLIFSYLNIGLVINIESTHCNGAEFKNLVDNLI